MKLKKVFFVHTGLATFVKNDLDILSENYKVVTYYYKPSSKIFDKIGNVFKSIFNSAYQVVKSDILFVWFGGFHGFFPVLFARLLGKKSIVIVGGFDASYVPSIQYGVFYHGGFQLWVTKKIYQWCTYICPVDESLIASTNYYADPSGLGFKTGILNFMDLPINKFKVISTGYDSSFFKLKTTKKSIEVLTVAKVMDGQTYKRKGFDVFIELAGYFPNFIFKIVGLSQQMIDNIKLKVPANVKLYGYCSQEELIELYSNAKFYFQLSMAEGLPNSLCEAMLCECIPVGSDVNGIPEAIGEMGVICFKKDINDVVDSFNDLVSSKI